MFLHYFTLSTHSSQIRSFAVPKTPFIALSIYKSESTKESFPEELISFEYGTWLLGSSYRHQGPKHFLLMEPNGPCLKNTVEKWRDLRNGEKLTSRRGKCAPFCRRFLVFIPVNRGLWDPGPSRLDIDKGGHFFSFLLYPGGADETLGNWDIY